MTVPLLELRDIAKRFAATPDLSTRIANRLRRVHDPRIVHAVDGVDLQIARGEVVGLVGESGCGKSTLGRVVAGLHAASAGIRLWKGTPIALEGAHAKAQRLAIQMIFQDPYASLNPRMRVIDLLTEAPVAHGIRPRAQREQFAVELLTQVGLDSSALRRYPHQFSGGQRARVGIARALAVSPQLLVCDEAVAALDVSTQAQVLNLFMDLRDTLGLTYLFISHDLAVVRHLSDRVLIMYLGRIVESAATTDLYAAANHPYTQALLAETPTLAAGKRHYTVIRGEIPSPLAPPSGCHFHPRCPRAKDVPGDRCRREQPVLKIVAEGHRSACHLNDLVPDHATQVASVLREIPFPTRPSPRIKSGSGS
ncbi:MAG: oligopeptide/dipeptide ABC transporter ATP-binding protein [Burkholderiaceae bacterium]